MAPQAFAGHSRRVRLRDVGTVEGAGLREAEWGSVAVGCCIPGLGSQEEQVAPEAV